MELEKTKKELLLEKWSVFSSMKGICLNRFIQENTIQSQAIKELIEKTAVENDGVIQESFITCLGCDRTSVEVTFLGRIIVS